MKKLILAAACLAMTLTASADYYLAGGNIDGGTHWDPNNENYKFTPGENNTYTLLVSSFGGEFKITNGNWGSGNEWTSNGSKITLNTEYELKRNGGNIGVDNTYENVLLTITEKDGGVYLNLSQIERYSLVGSNINGKSVFNTSDFGKYEFVKESEGIYKLHVDKLGSNFKILVAAKWEGSIGRADDNQKITSGVEIKVKGDNAGNILFTNIDEIFNDVDLVLNTTNKDDMRLTVTSNGAILDGTWYIVGNLEGWTNTKGLAMDYVGDGIYELNVEKLSTEFKIIYKQNWGTQLGRTTDDKIVLGEVSSLYLKPENASSDSKNIQTYKYGDTWNNFSNVKVILNTKDNNYTIRIVPQKWYIIGKFNNWTTGSAVEMILNEETGCYEANVENFSTGEGFKIINARAWSTGEWTTASGSMCINRPFQLTSERKDDNILFKYVNKFTGTFTLDPKDFTLTFSGETLEHKYPTELALTGSLTGDNTKDWGSDAESILPLALDDQTGIYTSGVFDFPANYEIKVKEGYNNIYGENVWGSLTNSFSYDCHEADLIIYKNSEANINSTIGGRHAVQFDINTFTLTFLEDYAFSIGDINFVKEGTKHYMEFSIEHGLASGVKHYLIEVYCAAPQNSQRRAPGSEVVVGSLELSDLDAVSGRVELTNLPDQDKSTLKVRAVAKKYYGEEGVAPLNAEDLDQAKYLYDQTDGTTTGVESIADDFSAPAEYYNLQGQRVVNPTNGMYIRVSGGKTIKVVK